jgi:RimJ/RimL family protein N-acetyltransferase
LAQLAGDRRIADTTISIPHPYTLSLAQSWIAEHECQWLKRLAVHFAIELKSSGSLIGALSLREIESEHRQAELGFWIAVTHWGKGHASEAVEAVLPLAFQELGLNRIYAHHMTRNPASGRVLQKAGFQVEGLLRQRVFKWDRYEDVTILALLASDWRCTP